MLDEATISTFGDLAPAIKAANLVSLMDPSKFDDETLDVIARSTGTDPEFVACLTEAVDEANELMGGASTQEVSMNYSRTVRDICREYDSSIMGKGSCGPADVARIVFALDRAALASYTSKTLANKINRYIHVNFDLLNSTIKRAKKQAGIPEKKNFELEVLCDENFLGFSCTKKSKKTSYEKGKRKSCGTK